MFLNDERNDWGREERPKLGEYNPKNLRPETTGEMDNLTKLFVSNYRMKIAMKRMRKIERRKLRRILKNR